MWLTTYNQERGMGILMGKNRRRKENRGPLILNYDTAKNDILVVTKVMLVLAYNI